MGRTPKIDWSSIKAEYITSHDITLKELAVKYNVAAISVSVHCQKEEWAREKKEYNQSIADEIIKRRREQRITVISDFNDMCAQLSTLAIREMLEELYRLKANEQSISDDNEEDKYRSNVMYHLKSISKAFIDFQKAGYLAIGLPQEKVQNEVIIAPDIPLDEKIKDMSLEEIEKEYARMSEIE